jgi:hypothetical protein
MQIRIKCSRLIGESCRSLPRLCPSPSFPDMAIGNNQLTSDIEGKQEAEGAAETTASRTSYRFTTRAMEMEYRKRR